MPLPLGDALLTPLCSEVPLARLTELFNANNFIISHIPSFWTASIAPRDEYESSLFGHLAAFVSDEVRHRINQLAAIGLLPDFAKRLVSFFTQPALGDLQIVPPILWRDLRHLTSSPTQDYVAYCVGKGERAVWRRLGAVRIRCAIEFAIDDVLRRLRREHPRRGGQRLPSLPGFPSSSPSMTRLI
jgi:TAG lipase/lysophosphatidylethanolamine acyltransferase